MIRSVWMWIVIVLLIVIVSGLIWHKCQVDNLKDQNRGMLQQLLESNDYQAKKIDDTTYMVKTIQSNQLSDNVVSEEIKKALSQYNLEGVVGSYIQLSAKIDKVISGQTSPVVYIPHSSPLPSSPTSQPTTIVINQPISPEEQQSREAMCNQCLTGGRIRIPFAHSEHNLMVSGWAETGDMLGNPGSYNLNIDWTKDINLNIVVAQDEDGNWHSIVNTEDVDLEVMRIVSNVNTQPFDGHWYNGINFGGAIGFGYGGAITQLFAGYRFMKHYNILGTWWYVFDWDGNIGNYHDSAFYGITFLYNL